MFGILVLTGLTVLLVLATRKPADFDPPRSGDPVVVDRANLFEQSFASEVTLVRENPVPWAVRLREEDVNAWLWVRLPAWVAHFEGSNAFGADSMLQVRFLSDRVLLCTDRITLVFTPRIDDQGLRLSAASGAALGRLPLPATLLDAVAGSIDLESLLGSMAGDRDGSLIDRQGGAWRLPNRITLVDGRVVELLEVRLEEGEVVLVLQTLPASTVPSSDN